MNIKVEKVPTGGNALKIAEGTYKISLVDASGKSEADDLLVDGDKFNQIGVEDGTDSDNDGIPDQPNGELTNFNILKPVDGSPKTFTDVKAVGVSDFSQGKLKALSESFGYEEGGVTKGLYPDMLDNLDRLAYTFGSVLNAVHKKGYDLESDTVSTKNIFDGLDPSKANYKDAAKSIQMSNITEKELAASVSASNGGNGTNAINLANVTSMLLSNTIQKLEGLADAIDLTSLSAIDKGGTIRSFYEGVIGRLGVDAQQAVRMTKNSTVLAQSVETNRQSISSVSLDEEMTDLIKFQHAYNAAARNITVVDEMLDKIINGMGTVGR